MNHETSEAEVETWCAKVVNPADVRRWRRDEKISAIMGHVIRIAWWGTLVGAGYTVARIIEGLA